MSTDQKPRTIAFDFDGVISQYHGFAGLEHTGEPIPEIVETIRTLKGLGHTIIVCSTRSTDLIRDYCNKHAIPVDYINDNPLFPDATGSKPVASVYVDDRGLCFNRQSSEVLVEQILNFQPYWRKE
ncbi:MAG: hypothetical protein AAB511_03060 [Patescibacteria group bacterium]